MQLHLDTYGTYLHVKDQLFEIKIKKDGVAEKHQVAAHKVKSIWIGKGIALSSEAVKLAIQNNIDIVFLEYDGQPIGRIWHSKLGSTTLIRKRQLECSLSSQALVHVKEWVGNKVGNQLLFIQDLKKHRKQHEVFLNTKIEQISALKVLIESVEDTQLVDEVADQLRSWEGTAGRMYFAALSYVLSGPYQFKGRSSRPAVDQFNAFLNYAYGMLYSKIEKSIILAGLDPYVGFMHRDGYNYKSMVYDFIEPYRIYADNVVFKLFSGKKVNKAHTDSFENGMKLNKEGKVLLVESLNQYLEGDKIRYKGRNQTRMNAMQFDAHQFANKLISKE